MAGASLVAERAGYELLGFDLEVLALTVAHFHFAGFAAALVAGLVCHAVRSRWADAAALSVPAGTALVFAGYLVGDAVELVTVSRTHWDLGSAGCWRGSGWPTSAPPSPLPRRDHATQPNTGLPWVA